MSDDVKLRIECLLRRAGLAGVPTRVAVTLGIAALALVAVAFWQFWPTGSAQDGYAYESAARAETADGSESAGMSPAGVAGGSGASGGSTGEASADGAGAGAGGSSASSGSAGASGTGGGSSGADGAAANASVAELSVDVEGAVKKPGLYTLPSGSRVGDAVERAGGMKKSAAKGAINLAQKLEDGMQVYVPESQDTAQGTGAQAGQQGRSTAATSGQGATSPAGATGSSSASGGSEGALVNLNSASLEELQTLPGVGPVLAQSIVSYREQNGSFASVDDIKNVSGIGDTRFERLRDLVCV